MTDKYAERIVRIEKTLVAIYENLPGFIQAAIAKQPVMEDPEGYTIRDALKDMHSDTKRFDETGQI